MSESRSEFEAWALRGNMSIGTLRHIGYAEGSYSDSRTHAAWLGWQASRRAALESAANVFDAMTVEAEGHTEDHWAFGHAAEVVRALAAKTQGE